MKRNQYILLLVFAALALMIWAGVYNFFERRQQAERARAGQVVLVPQGSAPQQDPDAGLTFLQGPLQGQPAPAFTLEDISGRKVSLSDYKGKAVLVNFWATWCGPCRIEIPWFVKLHDQYAAQGFEILGVSNDDLDKDDKARLQTEKSEIGKFISDQHINYPVLLDGDAISKPFGGVDSLPSSFFINRKGVVVASTVGLASRDEVEANIKKALAD